MSYVIALISVLAVGCYSVGLHILDRKKSPWKGAGQVVVTVSGIIVYMLVFMLLLAVMGADINQMLLELAK